MSQRGVSAAAALLIALNLALIGLTAWKIWQANQPELAMPVTQQPPVAPQHNNLTVTSAKGAFAISFPAGWDRVLRIMDSDRFIVAGLQQPKTGEDVPAKVQDVATFDGVESAVFDAVVDEDLPSPEGEASDILIGTGASLLSGRRYEHTYVGNNLTGQRKNGDLDYVYSFPLGGKKELRITYRVYASDSTNNSQTVEEIVQSIRKLK